jgi:hypothetical protein
LTLDNVDIEIVHQKDPVRARTTITAKLNFKSSNVNLCRLLGLPTLNGSDAKPLSPLTYLEGELLSGKSTRKGNFRAK